MPIEIDQRTFRLWSWWCWGIASLGDSFRIEGIRITRARGRVVEKRRRDGHCRRWSKGASSSGDYSAIGNVRSVKNVAWNFSKCQSFNGAVWNVSELCSRGFESSGLSNTPTPNSPNAAQQPGCHANRRAPSGESRPARLRGKYKRHANGDHHVDWHIHILFCMVSFRENCRKSKSFTRKETCGRGRMQTQVSPGSVMVPGYQCDFHNVVAVCGGRSAFEDVDGR